MRGGYWEVPVPVLGAVPEPDSVPGPLPLSAGGVAMPPEVPVPVPVLGAVPVPVPVSAGGVVVLVEGAAGCLNRQIHRRLTLSWRKSALPALSVIRSAARSARQGLS